MFVFKQLFTCCLLVALSYTSASDGEPAFNNDNVRAELSPTTGDETQDVCLGDLLETDCCAKTNDIGLHTLATGEEVFCWDGWAIFQRRKDGSIPDFHEKSWEEYAEGFGDVNEEFWLGLRKIHQNTKRGGCKLRVDLQSFDYDTAYEEYSQFSVADEANLFRISVGGYSGTAGDSLTMNGQLSIYNINEMAFSTIERNNDWHIDGIGMKFCTKYVNHDNIQSNKLCANGSGINCAKSYYTGGWWNNDCCFAAPNGRYGDTQPDNEATKWKTWKENDPMKFIQMGVRCD